MNDRIATEQQSFEQILNELPLQREWTDAVFSRVSRIAPLPKNPRVLDVGAAAGGFLITCWERGNRCEGIEPWAEARSNASRLSSQLKAPIHMVAGVAEFIPLAANTYDFVHASSVIEHVIAVDRAFEMIYRVLKPGGGVLVQCG